MKTIVTFICFGIACYGFIMTVFYFFQEKFLFFPGPAPFGNCPEMEVRGARANQFENIRYYLQTESKPDSWILVFHGNAGNACDRIYFLDLLKEFNSNIAVFEYPGYGKDSNSPKESLIIERAHEFILHIKDKNPDGLPIYLVGESLGTGVATIVSARTDVSGLILISAYTSIAAIAQHHYPWLPAKYLLKHRFDAERWAGETKTPALLFHGANDAIIPVDFARQQAMNLKGEMKLVEIPGCGHNDILDLGENRIQTEIDDFMEKQGLLRE